MVFIPYATEYDDIHGQILNRANKNTDYFRKDAPTVTALSSMFIGSLHISLRHMEEYLKHEVFITVKSISFESNLTRNDKNILI